MTFEIYDNFLDEGIFNNITSELTGAGFPWYYNEKINDVVNDQKETTEESLNPDLYNYQLTHKFYDDYSPQSNWWYLVEPIIKKIGANSVLRVKANLGMATPVRIAGGLHTDYGDKYKNSKTGVFYINTNNGSTIFEDGSEVASVKNRFVTFNTDILHSGVSCTDSKNRIVINFCYYDN
jgi:hypothetical protein